MTELASWGSLTYFMKCEESLNSHVILVQDLSGRKATFNLEKGSQIKSNLSFEDNMHAKRMIQDMRDDFLEYWIELKKKGGSM